MNKNRFRFYIIILTLAISQSILSQKNTQTIKGRVFDKETSVSLPGANVSINTDPICGATSDENGNYKIIKVPIGRYNIRVTFIGYENETINEVLVSSGKEVVINIGLTESVKNLQEVIVKSHIRKDLPMNSMAMISARSFTVEETRRYAGGLDDPARMVSAFAGVTVGNLQDNAIIIRGNSPKGLAWRLEGVDIPNPNHFVGGNVAGGGFVNIISGQTMANSDFYTGAFPAEYGNALAGVFDMKLRCGNNDEREYTIQAGVLGIDISSEGPFIKGINATYLFNYRYSTMSLLVDLGIIPSDQIPRYQDLTFKLNFPTKKAGIFSIWGIGAIDENTQPIHIDSSEWRIDWDRVSYKWNINTGAIGLTHKYIFGNKSYINTSLVGSGIDNQMDEKRLDDELISRPNWYFDDKSAKITLSSFINHKFNAKHTNRTGINMNLLIYNLNLNSTIMDIPGTFQNFVKENNTYNHIQFYSQSKYTFLPGLTLNAGFHSEYFSMNNKFTFDPRTAISWEFIPQHSISFGFGKHSQLEELKIYGVTRKVGNNTYYPNKNLGFSHALHFIVGYDWSVNENLRLKIEPYYQYLYDIPGIPDSSYSLINFKQDWVFRDSLANNSTGRNVGIEFTLERFLNNNFYYLFTASIFDSKYRGDDGILRNTRYNKGFVFNFLGGKEFFIGKNKNNVLGLNTRINIMGGERISPIIMLQSLQEKRVIYNDTKAFEEKESTVFYVDLSVTYRINKKKYSSIWAVQVKNVLGMPLDEGYSYNFKEKKIIHNEAVVVLPVISYKIEF